MRLNTVAPDSACRSQTRRCRSAIKNDFAESSWNRGITRTLLVPGFTCVASYMLRAKGGRTMKPSSASAQHSLQSIPRRPIARTSLDIYICEAERFADSKPNLPVICKQVLRHFFHKAVLLRAVWEIFMGMLFYIPNLYPINCPATSSAQPRTARLSAHLRSGVRPPLRHRDPVLISGPRESAARSARTCVYTPRYKPGMSRECWFPD
jgi:hypothetical protein